MSTILNKSFILFPEPSRFLLKNAVGSPPKIWAGVTPSSTSTLGRILQDNHERWHIFFNDKGFHNHSAHIVLALWSLGAHEAILEAAYKESCTLQKPLLPSPSSIDVLNWKEHLGDPSYYDAYLKLFKSEIGVKGVLPVIEEYIFSEGANFGGDESKGHPGMAVRFVEGLIHPLIHTGYGIEFGLPGMVVEGLAMAAVHETRSFSKIFPSSLVHAVDDSAADLKESTPKKSVHALTILAQILLDSQFELNDSIDPSRIYEDPHNKHGESVRAYVDQWTLDGPIEKKIEELIWTNVIIYGIGGYQGKRPINASFFHMHLVTSSLFLSTLVPQLTRPSQETILRIYLTTSLAWYISCGRPHIDILRFYDDTTTNFILPGVTPSPHAVALPSSTSQYAITPNPWFPILQTSLVHPSDHLVKVQRALSHYASEYGSKSPGWLAGTELQNGEKLDGTLFLRVAILTAEVMGWVREGEGPGDFDV